MTFLIEIAELSAHYYGHREFTVELGRLAGFEPSKRWPLPGIQKLWYAFAPMMLLYRDFRTYGMDDESDESTVGN